MKNNIIDRVKTFEDACNILGIEPDEVLIKESTRIGLESHAKVFNAFSKLTIIVRVLNESWKPNWDNDKETKYYPWFEMRTVHGFDLLGVNGNDWISAVGSRLCFKNNELCEYATKQFKDIYEVLMKG